MVQHFVLGALVFADLHLRAFEVLALSQKRWDEGEHAGHLIGVLLGLLAKKLRVLHSRYLVVKNEVLFKLLTETVESNLDHRRLRVDALLHLGELGSRYIGYLFL